MRSPQLSSITTGFHPTARSATKGMRIAGELAMFSLPQHTHCDAILSRRSLMVSKECCCTKGTISIEFARLLRTAQFGHAGGYRAIWLVINISSDADGPC